MPQNAKKIFFELLFFAVLRFSDCHFQPNPKFGTHRQYENKIGQNIFGLEFHLVHNVSKWRVGNLPFLAATVRLSDEAQKLDVHLKLYQHI